MLKELNTDEAPEQGQWLSAFWKGDVSCTTSGESALNLLQFSLFDRRDSASGYETSCSRSGSDTNTMTFKKSFLRHHFYDIIYYDFYFNFFMTYYTMTLKKTFNTIL